MADVKRYEDYGIPLLRQGGWERTGEGNDYIKYTDPENPNKQLRICTLDYIPNLHPNTITITGKANKEIEVSLLALRNDNYIIAALGWHENGYVFDIGNDYDKLAVMFRYTDNSNITPNDVTLDGVWAWVHSLRKLTTATEAVENPLYSDGTAITSYTIKGNTVQNGTPTPSNPVDVNGVGVRTINIYDGTTSATNARLSTFGTGTYAVQGWSVSSFIPIKSSTSYCTNISSHSFYCLYDENKGFLVGGIISKSNPSPGIYANAKFMRFDFLTNNLPEVQLSEGVSGQDYEPHGYKIPISNGQQTTNIYLGSTQTTRQIGKYIFDGSNIFTTQRSTYRNNTALFATTAMTGTGVINRPSMNNYFVVPSSGINPQTLDYACSGFHPSDQFSSYYYLRVPYDVIGMTDSNTDSEFITALNTWLSSLYNSGNPMIAYYALATPRTAAVNEPLMKIGTYADTLSNATAIPTTEGANSITVDTTVQPSEFAATWTGWHNANVKEWDGSQWNE